MSREDLPKIDRMKFWPKWDKNDIHFGQYRRWSRDAEDHWKDGNLLVSDAITGEYVLVPFADIEYEEQPYTWHEQDPETRMPIGTEYDRHIFESYKEHQRLDEEAGEGLAVNRTFSIPVADGRAFYVVTKVNKKTCRVEWRNFGADEYTDHILGFGGTFPTNIIEKQVHYADGMRKLFGACKKAKKKEVA